MSKSPYNAPYKSASGLAIIDAAWTAAVRLQQFGYAEIASEVSVDVKRAMQIIRVWVSEGRLRVIRGGVNGRPRKIFEVIPADEIRVVPVPGDAYDQMWTFMRKTGGFSPVDLVAMCSVPVTIEEAAAYCRVLLTAGYLKVVQKAAPPNRAAIYRLINATGIKPPRLRRIACIVDPNLGTTLPMSEAQP